MKRRLLPCALGVIAGVTIFGLTASALPALAQDKSAAAPSKDAMQSMPRLQEKGTIIVKGDENWDDMVGFGKESTMTEMMTLMMVGGSGMEHMKMAAMKPGMKMDRSRMQGMAMDQRQGLPVTVTLIQNPPAVGDNTLDVLVTDAGGKPMPGLKLMATVAMISMDMGTERPRSVEGKDGHYSVPVNFSMKGPWRVMLMNDGKADKNSAVHASLDFNVDGKTRWTMPTAHGISQPAMPDQAMPDHKAADTPPTPGLKATDIAAQNKPMPANTPQKADPPQPATVPEPVKTATEATTAPDATKPAPNKATAPQAPGYQVMVNTPAKSLKVGKNMLDVTVLDPTGKPVTKAKVMGSVEMTSMDMGVTKPKAQEGKEGHYTVPVEFSMKGPWRVTLTVTPPKQKPFTKALDFNVPK